MNLPAHSKSWRATYRNCRSRAGGFRRGSCKQPRPTCRIMRNQFPLAASLGKPQPGANRLPRLDVREKRQAVCSWFAKARDAVYGGAVLDHGAEYGLLLIGVVRSEYFGSVA